MIFGQRTWENLEDIKSVFSDIFGNPLVIKCIFEIQFYVDDDVNRNCFKFFLIKHLINVIFH